MSDYREHALARCCWCGRAFVWGAFKGTPVWLCPTPACHLRQARYALTVSVKGGTERTLYVPLPRQVEFMESDARRVLYGGAAGGAKSHCLRWHGYLTCLRTSNAHVLLLRRNYSELEQTHMMDSVMEAPQFGAESIPSAKVVRFPNGSILRFGHCDDVKAAERYLSAQYDLILFDELVTFEETMFRLIASRSRTKKEGVRPRVLAGTNPGGAHAHWVRRLFIDKNVDRAEYPNYRAEDFTYVPSKLEDNPYLDAEYEESLLDLPPELRKAYRDGDWDIFPGQYFPEWRRKSHVSESHLVFEPELPRVRAVDWGFVKPGWCGWFVLLPDGNAYLEDEYVFSRTIASEVAQEITRRTRERGVKVRYTVGDTAMWTPDSQTGEALSETFARFGVPMVQADKDRINGWARLRHWFKASPSGQPWLVSSPECRYFNRTMPSLVSDEHKPEDVDSDGEDHAADAARYWAMSRPMPGSLKATAAAREGTWAWWKRLTESGEPTGILGGR